MRSTLIALLFVTAVPLARGDEAIPARTLNDIKGATAFIKLQAGPLQATGSGFLVKVEGDTGYLVTNHHVVVPDRRGLPTPRLSVVFWSGTRKEQVHPAEVLGSDADRDLAVLKVSGVKELPAPLDLAQKVELIETLPVFVFGFPFGEALSLTKGNPAITIGKGSISSIRTNELDQVALVQLDGDLNPGNSGGPVVDGKGRLVGVAVARLRGTRIGMAIPPGELSRMLNGRVSGLHTRSDRVSNTTIDVEIETPLIDPLRRMRSVEILYLPAGSLKEKPKTDGETLWTEMAGADKVALKIDGAVARGKVRLTSKEKGRVVFLFQTAFVQGEGRRLMTAVTEHPLNFGEVVVERPGVIPNPPPIALKDRVTQMLPASVNDVAVGAGGRFLILHLPQVRKLVVWDVYLSKIARELPVAADHARIAANADKLIVVLPAQKLIQRYSLKTFEREATVPLKLNGTVKGMAMGSASGGPLLLGYVEEGTGNELPHFMDPLTLRPMDLDWPGGKVVGFTGEFLRASANGQLFTARQGVGSEPHTCVALLIQGRAVKPFTAGMPGSLLLPTPDGEQVCAETGVYSRELKPIFPREPRDYGLTPFLAPVQGPYFLRFAERSGKDEARLSLFAPGHERPFAVLEDIEGHVNSVVAYGKIPNPLMHDKRVFLVPDAKVLVTIPLTNDRLVVRPLDIDGLLQKAPFDLLFIATKPPTVTRAGANYTYQVSAKSNKGGMKFKLETGPPGMKVSPQGLVEWDVPAKGDRAEHDVVVSVTDAAGQEVLHSYTLTVEK
jgi:S1-C subfamily serine protease